MPEPLSLEVNGVEHRLDVDPERLLLDVLRESLGLTGTKYGCGEGQCGACAVLVDGAEVRSCQVPIATVEGCAIRTIEGFADGETLHPVQQAFVDQRAMQCGYCTPGMIVAATALLAREPEPSQAQIARALHGHVCRCGAYREIVEAVTVAARLAKGGPR